MDVVVQRILKTAKAKGMNQKQLAEKLEIHPQVVTDWKTKSTSYKQYIDKLSELLGVSADYLLNGAEPAAAPVDDPELVDALSKFGQLTDAQRAKVLGYMEGLLSDKK